MLGSSSEKWYRTIVSQSLYVSTMLTISLNMDSKAGIKTTLFNRSAKSTWQ